MQAKAIVFDFGGVLLDWNPERVYRPYFGNDSNMNKFFHETQILTHNKELDRGRPFDSVLRELSLQFPHYTDALWMWKNSWAKMLGGPIDESITLLKELHHKGLPLYGLTNWAAETFPYVFYTYDFFLLFRDIVVSGREGLIKPELEIFQLCLERNGLDPRATIFIDDNEENVAVAQTLGIEALHFRDPVRLRQDLRQLGVDV